MVNKSDAKTKKNVLFISRFWFAFRNRYECKHWFLQSPPKYFSRWRQPKNWEVLGTVLFGNEFADVWNIVFGSGVYHFRNRSLEDTSFLTDGIMLQPVPMWDMEMCLPRAACEWGKHISYKEKNMMNRMPHYQCWHLKHIHMLTCQSQTWIKDRWKTISSWHSW